tara:strand:- start:1712 stop:2440 length:729 start_codon:yes stop_codon:yes gene_type:complete
MDVRNYLTDNVFLCKNKLFYESNNKIKEVKKNNWHHILNEFGWEKLHKQWIKKLNKFLPKPMKNSLYGCLDCGSDGDCLFDSICYAISNNWGQEMDTKQLRRNISEKLTRENYNKIIEYYRILYEKNDFEENWNPNEVTFDMFKELLIEGGNKYWGDFLIINLIHEHLDINIIILNSNEINNEFYYYPLLYNYNIDLDTIILLYEDNMHFKLVGYFDGNIMQTMFNQKNIPIEILKLINQLR